MNKKHNFNKIILKSYEYLYKYKNLNKFNIKKNDNLNHLYILYIQNNYNFNFDFDKKKYTTSKKFVNCLKSLYEFKSKNKNSLNNLLFNNDELLGKIFLIDKKEEFDLDNFILKLEEKTYSLDYVDSHIQILDYYGKAMNDTEIIKCGFTLLLIKEQFPDINVNKTLQKNIIKAILKIIEPKQNKISYINTQALMILFLLNKEKYYENLDNFINKLCSSQLANGKWNNGYNSYFIKDIESLDAMHTCFVLIVLLEYKTIKKKNELIERKKKMRITPSPTTSYHNSVDTDSSDNEDNNKDNNKDNNEDNNKYNNKDNNKDNNKEKDNNKDNKKEKDINVTVTKENIERFDNIISNTYELDFNFYNISLLLILILVLINYKKIKNLIKSL